jgi:hypothetical protein
MIGEEYFQVWIGVELLVGFGMPDWLWVAANGDRGIIFEAIDRNGPVWGVTHSYN